MNNGIFPLGAPPSYTPINSSQNLLGIPSVIPTIYSYPQNKTAQVNYNNLVFVIDTQKSSGSNRIFSISLEGTVSCFIDWGDGSVERFTTTGVKSHTYASFGEYTIQIYGTLTGFSMLNAGTNRLPMTKCLSFGTLALTSFDFHSCSNLIQVPDNIPTGVTTLNNCFANCSNLNWPGISNWNISRITAVVNLFYGCSSFDQNLNMWDTRNITNFTSCFFNASKFNKPISSWNVGKCSNFSSMFYGCTSFNQDLSNWNIGEDSSVTGIDMSNMFNLNYGLSNQDFSNWNMSKTTSINSMFFDCRSFNGNVSGWNLTLCTNLANVFSFNTIFNKPLNWINTSGNTTLNGFLYAATSFNQSLENLDVSRVSVFNGCFQGATSFNQPLSGWNIGASASVTGITMQDMFNGTNSFNQNLSSWDMSKVTTTFRMFQNNTAFNGSVSGWNMAKCTTTSTMFQNATSFNNTLNWINTTGIRSMASMFQTATAFNKPIENLDVGRVVNFTNMFWAAYSFNQSLSGWNVGANTATGINMAFMFNGALTFNGNIGFDTSKTTNMLSMLSQTAFNNSSLTGWNVTNVTNMNGIFVNNTVFNQDISSWDIKGLNASTALFNFMPNATLSTTNYNNILIAWNSRKATYRTDLSPHFGSSKYTASASAAATARAALVAYGWTITDGGSIIQAPDVPTSLSATAGDTQVSLTWSAPTYNNGASITDYIIQYSSNDGSSWTTFSDGTSTTTSATVTGLTNGTSYIFRVAAVNSAGTGPYSSYSNSVTPAGPYGSYHIDPNINIEEDTEI